MRTLILVLALGACAPLGASTNFVRGDTDGSDQVGWQDAMYLLLGLFTEHFGNAVTDCPDAADANDDGLIDLGDAVYLLSYTLNSGPPPPAPFPDPGPDPTLDGLECP